jgi:SAM-dependent methyltransferase
MAKRSHKQIVHSERKFPTGKKDGYRGFCKQISQIKEDFYSSPLHEAKQASTLEILAAFDSIPPEYFADAYSISDDDLENRLTRIQRKYIMRFPNICRSWALLLQYLPELMTKNGTNKKILEMSSAHGATLEVLNYFGHKAIGNDYANFVGGKGGFDTKFRSINEAISVEAMDDHGLNTQNDFVDWPYKPIIESIGADVRLFDAGILPYPFKNKEFDTTICFDALEHYAHPKDWMEIVQEFVRISRESVLVIPNRVQSHIYENKEYMADFKKFQNEMRAYNDGKFRCVYAGLKNNQLNVFKLMKTG